MAGFHCRQQPGSKQIHFDLVTTPALRATPPVPGGEMGFQHRARQPTDIQQLIAAQPLRIHFRPKLKPTDKMPSKASNGRLLAVCGSAAGCWGGSAGGAAASAGG